MGTISTGWGRHRLATFAVSQCDQRGKRGSRRTRVSGRQWVRGSLSTSTVASVLDAVRCYQRRWRLSWPTVDDPASAVCNCGIIRCGRSWARLWGSRTRAVSTHARLESPSMIRLNRNSVRHRLLKFMRNPVGQSQPARVKQNVWAAASMPPPTTVTRTMSRT
jgi:hypothetical protein